MIEIQVTCEDIKNGIKDNYTYCPIALALRRVLPTSDIEVSVSFIWVDNMRYRPSLQIQRFIRDFDAGRIVEPFSFALDDEEFRAW